MTAPAKRRILIADEQAVFRDGLKWWLAQQPDLECCEEADSAAAIRKAVGRSKPDLLLTELRFKGEDGLELIKSLRASHPDLPILVLSQNNEQVFGDRALRVGVRGYVMKDQPGPEVMHAIRVVLAGEVYVNKPLAAIMIRKLWQGDTSGDITTKLSDRELQVFRMLGSGIGTKEVARRLALSVKTVETYREHLKRKLGVKDAPSLVHMATTWVQNCGASLETSQPAAQT